MYTIICKLRFPDQSHIPDDSFLMKMSTSSEENIRHPSSENRFADSWTQYWRGLRCSSYHSRTWALDDCTESVDSLRDYDAAGLSGGHLHWRPQVATSGTTTQMSRCRREIPADCFARTRDVRRAPVRVAPTTVRGGDGTVRRRQGTALGEASLAGGRAGRRLRGTGWCRRAPRRRRCSSAAAAPAACWRRLASAAWSRSTTPSATCWAGCAPPPARC